jgi:hypothetical protein
VQNATDVDFAALCLHLEIFWGSGIIERFLRGIIENLS